jgi:hypothetical protein
MNSYLLGGTVKRGQVSFELYIPIIHFCLGLKTYHHGDVL